MKTILIVDDSQANRDLLREVLSTRGYRLVEACDGEEAMQKVVEESPDLVLLDIHMPTLDGYAVLKKLRQDSGSAKLCVVAVTSFAMQSDENRGLAAGFDAYITKPVDLRELLVKVAELIG